MAPPLSKFQQLESDPEFAKLSYREQIQLRADIAQMELPKDKQFMQLPDEQKELVLKDIMFRPPKMEKGARVFGIPVSPGSLLDQFNDLDQGKLNAVMNQMVKGGEAPNLPGLRGTDMRILTQALRFGAGFKEGTGVITGVQNLVRRAIGDDSGVRNETKLIEWIRNIQSEDSSQATLGGILEGAGMISGFGAELSIPYGGLVGSISKPAGIAKLLMKIPKAAKMSRWTYLLARSGIHAAAGGVVGIVRENLRDLVQGNLENKTFGEIALNTGRYFGEYALGDLAGFFVLGGLKRAGKALKWTFIGPPKGLAESLGKRGNLLLNMRSNFNNAFVDALSGKGVSQSILKRRGDEQFKTMIDIVESHGRVMRHVDKPQLDDVVKAFGISLGPDHAVAMKKLSSNKWQALDPIDGRVVKQLADAADALDWLTVQSQKLPKLKAADKGLLAVGSQKMQLTENIRKALPTGSRVRAELLSSAIAPVGGKFNQSNVRMFAKEFLRGTDIDPTKVRTVLQGDKIVVLADNKPIGSVPKTVVDPMIERSSIEDLVANLKKAGGAKTGVDINPENFRTLYEDVVRQSPVHYTPGWVHDVVEQDFRGKIRQISTNKFELQLPDGPPQIFNSFDEMGNYVVKSKMVDDKLLKTYLATYEGIDLKKVKDGYQLYKGQSQIGSAGTVDELLTKYPDLTPKIPAEYAPEFTFVTNKDVPGGGVFQQNKIAFGTAETLLEEFDKYLPYATDAAKTQKLGGKLAFNRANRTYTISVPELNYSITTKNPANVQKWLARKADDYTLIKRAAESKGYKIELLNGQWMMYTKGKTIVARTKEDLIARIKEMPRADFMPELTGIMQDFYENLDQYQKLPTFRYNDNKWKIRDEEGAFVQGPGWIAMNYMRPTELSLEVALKNAVKKSGGGQAESYILKSFRRLEDSRNIVSVTLAKAENLMDDAFRVGGKQVKEKTRVLIGELMNNNLDDPKIVKLAGQMGLKPEHIDVARKARDTFNQLFDFYGINPDKFRTEYLPRMRAYHHTGDMGKYVSDTDSINFLKDAFGGQNVPSDVEAFFRHSRTKDVADALLEDDPLMMLKKYISIGQREKYFGVIMDDINSWRQANKANIDPALVDRFKIYLQDFCGVPPSINDNMERAFASRFFQKLGIKRPPSKFMDALYQLEYASALGFRPGTAMRNLTQPFMTTGSRIGHSWVVDAMDIVGKDKDGLIFKKLINNGVIPSDLPFFSSEQIMGKGGVLEKATKLSTRWIKTSDSMNRMVAYTAAEQRFNWALRRYKAGSIDLNKFVMDESGLWSLSDDLLDVAKKHINGGDFDSARDLFATQITKETQFDYKAGLMPIWARGTMGKAFGQFMTYPINFISNIRHGFSRARTPAQKLAFAGRYIGTASAMGAAMSYLGLRADDFFPGPVTVSGGPYFHLMVDILDGFSKSPTSAQTRARYGFTTKNGLPHVDPGKLLSSQLFTQLIPGSLQFRNIMRGVDYANNGDLYRAFISWTSLPVDRNHP